MWVGAASRDKRCGLELLGRSGVVCSVVSVAGYYEFHGVVNCDVLF